MTEVRVPKGYFKKLLAIDVETTGFTNGEIDVSKDQQILSIGLVVADTNTYKEIDNLYLEIKWNKQSKWSNEAERVHGLSKEYLEKNGIEEEDAAVYIAEFLLKHFDVDDAITLLGLNVSNFDYFFLYNLLHKFGLKFKFSHRKMDAFSLSMGTIKQFNSDDIFAAMGYNRTSFHNALGDARIALATFRNISNIWDKLVNT